MSIIRISDNVYSVGVLNPALRVFDIVMRAEYGTSYNAYLITGEKNILIDCVHSDFFDEYLNNLRCLVDIESIDAIVMNHTELDHSGSLKKLLQINPKITVIGTIAAERYLRAITHEDFDFYTVKHNEVLQIGNRKLRFVIAPLLHWPDSMMTWFEEDKTLFSCDFLGAHFCEPSMLDTDIRYKDAYSQEFLNYYQGIFSPFKPYVLAGLNKIDDLDISFICPSHGPVLSETARERMADYRNWSEPKKKTSKLFVILYASAYKCTKLLAEAAYNAVKQEPGVNAELFDIVDTDLALIAEKIANADALMVGSCTINKDAPKVVWDVLSSIDAINAAQKPAGVFGSYGWSGEAVQMMQTRLSQLRYNVIEPAVRVNFMPTEEDLEEIKNYALAVAGNMG